MSVNVSPASVLITLNGARFEQVNSFIYEGPMNKARIDVVTDFLEESGFSIAEIENVREALGSPPAWLPEGRIRTITHDSADGWEAQVVGTGAPPRLLVAMFDSGGPLQVGIRRKG